MLRWGILGAGTIADQAMAPAMRDVGHDLAVVGSRSLTRAQAFAARHGVRRARGSYDEVLAARDVDAVYVAMHTAGHEEWAVAALDAGKHVLCEQPLSANAASAARISAAAVAAGCTVMEAGVARFHPRTNALLEMIDAGEIGQVRLVHAAISHRMRDLDDFRADQSLGGGALLDGGSRAVAMVRWVLGEEPDGVQGIARRWRTGVDGATTALLSFRSGAIATVSASFEGAAHESLEIVGTQGTLRTNLPFGAAALDEVSLERDGTSVGTWQADPYQRMLAAFAAAAKSGAETPLPVEDAVATASVLDAIRSATG
jgi:D-xylose 1-dehydrogenase (NADP+, D-xylono-1,5-lactone-forming)